MGKSGPLGRLCKELGIEEELSKLEAPEHGLPLTWDYIDYARRDPIATRALFDKVWDTFRKHDVPVKPWHVYSEASIGKAYLRKIGITPLLRRFLPRIRGVEDGQSEAQGHCLLRAPRTQPSAAIDVMRMAPTPADERLLGYACEAFYGGRTDVGIKCKSIESILTDFTSQYPTVQILMGLQEVLLAKGLFYRSCVGEYRELLSTLTIESLMRRDMWPKLRGFVRILPNGDILPFRDKDGISVPTVTSSHAIWYTLADACASVLLTARIPTIIDAVALCPSEERICTNTIDVFGDSSYRIDVSKEEFFQRVIELRLSIKRALEVAVDEKGKERLNGLQMALKLMANATSYGIYNQITAKASTRNLSPSMFGPAMAMFIPSWRG